jgi:23S rRNA pseudouridine1911/1915/1917 synthase
MAELYSLHHLTVTAVGEPLFAVLATHLPGLSRHQARRAVTAGLVAVDGKVVLKPTQPLGERPTRLDCDLRHGIASAFHARLHDAVAPTEKPFTILHEDRSLVVVDKAAGVLSAPMHRHDGGPPERGHVPELLRRSWRKQGREAGFIGVVHRLDQDTSGCLCFALTHEAQRLIAAQFATHGAHRVYRCLVMKAPRRDQDTIRGLLGRGADGRRTLVEEGESGKEAVTHFRVLQRFAHGAELEVSLETGRTHQIRVSLAAIGCPVYGDRVYGLAHQRVRRGQTPPPKPPRLMLHAHRLDLDHPATGARLEVTAPLPACFAAFAGLLG